METCSGWKQRIKQQLDAIDRSAWQPPAEVEKCALRYPGWKAVRLTSRQISDEAALSFAHTLAALLRFAQAQLDAEAVAAAQARALRRFATRKRGRGHTTSPPSRRRFAWSPRTIRCPTTKTSGKTSAGEGGIQVPCRGASGRRCARHRHMAQEPPPLRRFPHRSSETSGLPGHPPASLLSERGADQAGVSRGGEGSLEFLSFAPRLLELRSQNPRRYPLSSRHLQEVA
jgi:hypothetical protein